MKVFRDNKKKITIKVSKELGPITQSEIVDKTLLLLKSGVSAGVMVDAKGNRIATYTKG